MGCEFGCGYEGGKVECAGGVGDSGPVGVRLMVDFVAGRVISLCRVAGPDFAARNVICERGAWRSR